MITLRAVPGISAEIVLAVDGEWLKTRLLRSHEQAELVSAVADTRAMFGEGVGVTREPRAAPKARRGH